MRRPVEFAFCILLALTACGSKTQNNASSSPAATTPALQAASPAPGADAPTDIVMPTDEFHPSKGSLSLEAAACTYEIDSFGSSLNVDATAGHGQVIAQFRLNYECDNLASPTSQLALGGSPLEAGSALLTEDAEKKCAELGQLYSAAAIKPGGDVPAGWKISYKTDIPVNLDSVDQLGSINGITGLFDCNVTASISK